MITSMKDMDKVISSYGLYAMPSITTGTIVDYQPDNLDYYTLSEMSCHPQISACLHIIKMPIIGANWNIKCDNKDIDDFCTQNVKSIFTSLIRDILTGIEYGFAGLEKRFEVVDGKIRHKKPISLSPAFCQIERKTDFSFVGLRQEFSSELIPAEKCIVFTPDMRFMNMKGKLRLKPSYDPWYLYKHNAQFASRFFEKHGTPQTIMDFPEGITHVSNNSDGTPVYRSNEAIASEIGQALRNSSTVTRPASRDKDGNRLWNIELLEAKGKQAADYVSFLQFLDIEMAKGIFVPELTFSKGGDTGSYSLGQSHLEVFLMSEQALLDLVAETINNYILPQLVEWNFGTSAPAAMLEFEPLNNQLKSILEDLVIEMVKGKVIEPDHDWLSEQMGIKLQEVTPAPEPKQSVVKPEQPIQIQTEKKKSNLPLQLELTPLGDNLKRIQQVFDKREQQFNGLAYNEINKIKDQIEKEVLKIAQSDITPEKKIELISQLKPNFKGYEKEIDKFINGVFRDAETSMTADYGDAVKGIQVRGAETISKANASILAELHSIKVTDLVKLSLLDQIANADLPTVMAIMGQTFQDFIDSKELQTAGMITVTKNFNVGRQSVAEQSKNFQGVQISEMLDNSTCPLCREIDGATFDINDPALQEWVTPSHIGCRRTLIYISKDETGFVPTGIEKPDEINNLVEKHGHLMPGYIPKVADVKGVIGKGEFLKTSSIKEAEEWAKNTLNIPAVNYKGLSIDVANDINKGLFDINNKFKIKLDEIITKSEKNADWILMHNSRGLKNEIGIRQLIINKAHFNSFDNYDKLISDIERKSKDGHWVPKNIEELIYHELAHYLTAHGKTIGQIQKEQIVLSVMNFGKELSYVGGLHGEEGIAEAFVKYIRGEETPPATLEIMNKYMGDIL